MADDKPGDKPGFFKRIFSFGRKVPEEPVPGPEAAVEETPVDEAVADAQIDTAVDGAPEVEPEVRNTAVHGGEQ
ncbi:MAG: hypothetical protein AAGH82_11270, partial [Pseudomonadota bacterium]